MTIRRRSLELAGILASGVLAAGCTAGSGTDRAPEEGAAGTDRCRAADLSAGITDIRPATGSRHAVLVLTNDSARPCTLNGHPGVRFLDEDRRPLPTDVRQIPPAPGRVVVESGTSASASLRWGVIGGDDPAVETAYARITPPDRRGKLRVQFDRRVSGGRIAVTGVVDGDTGPPARAGTSG